MSNRFKDIGGHLHTFEEVDEKGWDKTICSVALEHGHTPYVVSVSRPLTREELTDLVEIVHDFYLPTT